MINMDSDPNVKFLYRAMRERDPRKRKVKPVAPDRIQVNFGGFGDSDDDDSDFDITKQLKDTDGPLPDEEDDDEDEDNDDDDDDDDDVSSENDEEESDEDLKDDLSDDTTGVKKLDMEIRQESGVAENQESDLDEAEADVESMTETDESEETGDSEAEGEAVSDEEEEDGEEEENEEDDAKMLSPPIKTLENIWNSIDSDEDDEDYVPKKRRKKKAKASSKTTKSTDTKKATEHQPSADGPPEAKSSTERQTGPQKRIKVVVCCVCLSDKSSEAEEIVECDSCGITVHEGCYGISESQSVASTESSASTEPWFCDACKANVTKPVCQLCPNSGGVFKETDAGKWVHLVCALYTPGVAFGDVDKLNSVTLFEMPYTRWGAKECILCEDSRFSQTGVCINCDAGMCKAFFHVTCAQKEGLLAELAPEDVMEVADPFFAYCKLHADKFVSKMKRRNWMAIQSLAKSYTPCPITDEVEKARFQRKLSHHRDKYSLAKQRRPPAWVPTQKLVRHLHTSPSALRAFLRKAELMGILTQVENTPMENKEAVKKANPGQVTFTSDFITYFLERNVKVDSLKNSSQELKAQNQRLQAPQNVVRRQYEKINTEVNSLKQKADAIRQEGESLCAMLADIYGKPVANVVKVFRDKKQQGPDKSEQSEVRSDLINRCGRCQMTSDQHLLTRCDNCREHYHLGCLDPPLSRMPKKTKLFGWQCSFCVKSSSGDSVKSHPNVNEPRQLRETTKGPDKFFLLSHIQESLYGKRKKSLQTRKSKNKRKTLKRLGPKARPGPSKWKKPASQSNAFTKSKSKLKRRAKPKALSHLDKALAASSHTFGSHMVPSAEELCALDIICVVCNQEGQVADTVRCDDCMLSYHLRCLTPPMKKSPKVRGYAWHCEACDMSDSDEEVTGRRSKRPDAAHFALADPNDDDDDDDISFNFQARTKH